MARLPTPGSDQGTWGSILNDYLAQVHNTDGSLKNDVVGAAQLQDNSVTSDALAADAVDGSVLNTTNSPSSGQVLTYSGSDLTWATPASAPVTSVNSLTGAVVLTKSNIGLSNVDNTADASKPISTATQTALDAITAGDVDLIDGGSASTRQTNLKPRRGTAAQWVAANPTLAAGEIGFETDTGVIKVGDGSTTWTSSLGVNAAITSIPTPTGGLDDSALFTAAVAQLPATGGTIVLGPGVFKLPSGFSFSKRVYLEGQGMGNFEASPTRIECTSATADALTFTIDGSTVIDLSVVNTAGSTPTAGAGIRFTNARWSRIDRVLVSRFYNDIQIDAGWYYTISDSAIIDPINYGIFLRDTATGAFDWGDPMISGCTITKYNVGTNGGSAVRWESGGGVRFVNNKINGGTTPPSTAYTTGKFDYGLDLQVNDGGTTSVLVVTGNSIENFVWAGIIVGMKGPSNTGVFAKMSITGNEFLGTASTGIGVAIRPNAVNTTFGHVSISGNVIDTCGYGISVGAIRGVSIGPNTFRNIGTTVIDKWGTNELTDCNVDLALQVVTGDNVNLYNESTETPVSSAGPFAQGRYVVERETGSVTSNATYTNLYRIGIPQYGVGKLQCTIYGNLSGVGGSLYDATLTYVRTTGAVTATVQGTPLTINGPFDVTFDTATTAGDIIIGVKRNGASGTAFTGRAVVTVDGNVKRIKKGS